MISFLETVFWWVSWLVGLLQGQHRRRAKNIYLHGNFAPVQDEVFSQNLKVEGEMPAALNGLFIRTGPNPHQPPTGDYHWFDGDGMLHACRIKDGKVSYCNHLVRTSRLRQEKAAGHPLFLRFGDMRGKATILHSFLNSLRKWMGVIDVKDGGGTANTALVYHARKIMTLNEGDLPYAVRVLCDGVLDTIGRVTYNGKVQHAFTAHPKVDPATGEMFFFGYDVSKAPYCHYSLADAEGNLKRDFPITIPGPVMMHDFSITEDYAIIFDGSLVFKPEVVFKKKDAMPFVFDKAKPQRMGVLPRYASSEAGIKWFDCTPCVIFHTVNAWQEGDVVSVLACAFDEFSLDLSQAAAEGADVRATLPSVYEFRLDMASGACSRRLVSSTVHGDFPQVTGHKLGRKTRYAYIAVFDDAEYMRGNSVFAGVAKLDLAQPDPAKAEVGRLLHGPQRYGGEAYFVPASTRAEECKGDDDGYLVTYVHDEAAGRSEMVVYDAGTMASKPVAAVVMPQRVPYGFHCLHVNEEQFQARSSALEE